MTKGLNRFRSDMGTLVGTRGPSKLPASVISVVFSLTFLLNACKKTRLVTFSSSVLSVSSAAFVNRNMQLMTMTPNSIPDPLAPMSDVYTSEMSILLQQPLSVRHQVGAQSSLLALEPDCSLALVCHRHRRSPDCDTWSLYISGVFCAILLGGYHQSRLGRTSREYHTRVRYHARRR